MNTDYDSEKTIVGEPTPQTDEQQQEKKSNSAMWRTVSIGGVTGILLGVSSAAVAGTVMKPDVPQPDEEEIIETDEPVQEYEEVGVAHNVSDNMSFGEAFAAARAEVGPGGVFYWHGGTYGTYLKDEWDVMSDQDKSDYAERTAPYMKQGHDAYEAQKNDMAQEDAPDADGGDDSGDEPHYVDDDPDVQLIGMQDVTLEDGSVQTVAAVHTNGHDVVLIDIDNDGEFDVAGVDVNHDGELSDMERMDISAQHITTDSFRATESEMEENLDEDSFLASNGLESYADGMDSLA